MVSTPRPELDARRYEPASTDRRAGGVSFPVRVLVVEPDRADARLLGTALAKAGYTAETAPDLEGAFERLTRRHYDLALATDPLPDGSPLALLGPRAPAPVPLVVLCDSLSPEAVRAAYAAGVLEVLAKDGALLPLLPLRIERLLQLLADRRTLSDLFDENARLVQANALLRENGAHDPLTGALDERGLADAVRCETARAERNGTPLAAALFDVDGLRHLNAQRGREAGDALLKGISALIRNESRGGDLHARLDGDAFAVLLPGASLSGALRFAERLRERAASLRLAWPDDPISATVSGGVGLVLDPPETPAALVAWARERIRGVKEGGQNRVGLLV